MSEDWPPVPAPGTVPVEQLPDDDEFAPCDSTPAHCAAHHRGEPVAGVDE